MKIDIIWINGAFGAGKTTLVEELHRRKPESIIFDPERFGFMIQEIAPDGGPADFQDIPLWRKLVSMNLIEFAKAYETLILVPMTLVNPVYFKEIFDIFKSENIKVKHVYLDINKEILTQRIKYQIMDPDNKENNKKIENWRLAQIDRCLVFKSSLPKDTLIINSGKHIVSELADKILN